MASLAPAHAAHQKRAAIYVRVSSAAQEEDGTSLDTQLARCQLHAAERGYLVVEVHVYREVRTGTELWERPKLTTLRDAVRRRDVDVVIAYAIDRLSRDPVHLGVLLSEAEHARVAVEFVTEPLDNSPEGQLVRFVRGYAAKVEHEKIRERTIRGRRARAEARKLISSKRPMFGYLWIDDKGRYLEHPTDADTVRRIFRDCLRGLTLRQIQADLFRDGVGGPSGQTAWRHAQVGRILRNRAYTGAHEAFRAEERKRGQTAVKLRPMEDRIPLPAGVIPPLVSAADFDAVQTILTNNQRFSTRNNRQPEATLLRNGYARCGLCGASMVAFTRQGRGHFYGCVRGPDRFDLPCSRSFTVLAKTIDAAVWAKVTGVLTRPGLIAEELARSRDADPAAADLESLDRRAADVTRRQANLVRRLANEDDDTVAELLQTQLRELAAQERGLTAEREALLARRREWQGARERLATVEAWCVAVARKLDRLTYQQRRLTLDALGVRAQVFPRDHEPRLLIDMDIDPPANLPDDAIVSTRKN